LRRWSKVPSRKVRIRRDLLTNKYNPLGVRRGHQKSVQETTTSPNFKRDKAAATYWTESMEKCDLGQMNIDFAPFRYDSVSVVAPGENSQSRALQLETEIDPG
jgi:hypothetical protein